MPRRGRLRISLLVVTVLWALGACQAGSSTTPPSEPSPPLASVTVSDQLTVLFLGDSYTLGTALADDETPMRWTTRLARANGWREVNAGCNGSGYVRQGLRCGTNYRERLPLLADTDPDVVFVSGGVNDLHYPADEVAVAIDETLRAAKETFPMARIYVVNGIYYAGASTPDALGALNAALAQASAVNEVSFLDIGEPLLGHSDLMADDGLHPNTQGHAVIASRIQQAYDAALRSQRRAG